MNLNEKRQGLLIKAIARKFSIERVFLEVKKQDIKFINLLKEDDYNFMVPDENELRKQFIAKIDKLTGNFKND